MAPATYHPRLLQLKGKKNVVASEVKICIDSLNDGDSFIYDAGLAVYGYLVFLVIGEERRGEERRGEER